ncbi:HPP family protein [Novosphingobium aerophilum]|uniref:HPP family protein n=1 Tax=Novosphingobium TaxID=165696 RepID=UPI00104E9CCE|nr:MULTISPECIES: HPP family protein [unclassified Novosphingobium]MPS70353.1 HPP family protein [Novosphingobium sp.]WRT93656.1 HPP family protein [Novosphingobium sp. RL4]
MTILRGGLARGGLGRLGWMRGAFGGMLGIAIAGGVTWLLQSSELAALPFLVAPLGASTVLVFCVPASPLAQPWSVIGGNLISAMVGLAVGHLLGDPWLAGAVAVGLAIAAMSLTRSLHPPGGACALLYALGATGSQAWGISYLVPLALNVVILSQFGWIYNNLTGHPWPHRAPKVQHKAPDPYTRADIEALLAEWDEVLDVEVDDLDAFVQALLQRGRRA